MLQFRYESCKPLLNVLLRLFVCCPVSSPVVSAEVEHTTPAPSSSSGSIQMELFSSPDYRLPLDPSSKVQSDKRVYAEVYDSQSSYSVHLF